MKSFRDYLKEDVVPTAIVQDGSIDLEREVVRAQINSSLASVLADASVTPYNSLVRISKVLSYFNIILPKRVYLDGEKGIEAIELRQFGDRMGMNDQGEFIKEVPGKFYLFIQYWRTHPNVAAYGATANFISSTAGMFKVAAKIVDKVELDRLIDMAEVSLAESAESRQAMAKAKAPKEDPHTALGDCDCSQGDSPSTKSAISVSMRRKDKKLSADSLDEASTKKLVSYRNEAGECREKGTKLAYAKLTGKAKVKAAAPKHPYMEESIDEAMTRKQKYMAVRRFMSHDTEAGERILKMGKKDREEKKSFASAEKEANKWQKHRLKEADSTNYSDYKGGGSYDPPDKSTTDALNRQKSIVQSNLPSQYNSSYDRDTSNSEVRTRTQGTTPTRASMEEGRMPPSVIAHKQKLASMSDKEFAEKHGHKTEKQLRDMGARHGYGFDKATKTGSDHYVKRAASKQMEEAMGSVKKNYGLRKMKRKASTVVKQGLGVDKEKTRTILVTNKGDPHAATGGGVHRIPKDKYDPTKHNMASE